MARFEWRDWLALGVLGCGSSALATLLFTVAFTYGRPNTPVLLQQLQPLFAVAGARLLLGERLQRRYGLYLLGGLIGSYLVAFAHPLSPGGVDGWAPALLAVSAALLWGLGTVLGRRLGAKLPFTELTALRLGTGLVAALVALGVTGDGSSYSHLSAKGLLALVLLALVPGLLSLLVYYRGLRATPAAAATLGELAFPFTALFLNYLAFGSTLSPSQWVGLAFLVTTITTMGTLRANGTPTGVEVPELEKDHERGAPGAAGDHRSVARPGRRRPAIPACPGAGGRSSRANWFWKGWRRCLSSRTPVGATMSPETTPRDLGSVVKRPSASSARSVLI